LLAKTTERPPVGCVKVTVQEEAPGATTELGAHARLFTAGSGEMVMLAVAAVPPADAAIATEVELVTEFAVPTKAALAAPAGTVTEAGTVRAELLLEILTVRPPEGAACVNCAVQVVLSPDSSAVGLHVSEDMPGPELDTITCTAPPVPVNGMDEPAAEAATV
jgi:hypothetical protein